MWYASKYGIPLLQKYQQAPGLPPEVGYLGHKSSHSSDLAHVAKIIRRGLL